ncbi:MAG: 2-amino-4-hydroxy-6-hydroxymethyldihydropteridine pyrophosphokinae [Verrucomicrobiota bacterium]|jgi:2-amino-4-hydroxy-6-hydroxymethyldihydropteridine diphosphokinase
MGLLRSAVDCLGGLAEGEVLLSGFWGSEPVGCPAGSPDFINAVAGFRPRAGLSPERCLEGLQRLEEEFGRRRGVVRNAPRTLDLDLLAFGEEVRCVRSLVLPHPQIAGRRFVLAPWSEVAARFRVPGLGRTVGELLAALPEGGRVWRVGREAGSAEG